MRRDGRGDRVGLVAGDGALLDREVGGVAGGVHAGEPGDAAVGIDRYQPEHAGGGNPGDARAAHQRERDDAVGGDRAARVAAQPHAAADDVGVLGADEVDARRAQRPGDDRARRGAEQFERPHLRRDQRDANRIAAVGGDQCGLVERQEPAGGNRHDEREAVHGSLPDLVRQRLQLRRALGVEGDHAVEGGDGPRARSQYEGVVGQRAAGPQHDAPARRVDGGHRAGDELAAERRRRSGSAAGAGPRRGRRARRSASAGRTKSGSGATRVICTRSPASSRSASRNSSPANPAPTTTIRGSRAVMAGGSGLRRRRRRRAGALTAPGSSERRPASSSRAWRQPASSCPAILAGGHHSGWSGDGRGLVAVAAQEPRPALGAAARRAARVRTAAGRSARPRERRCAPRRRRRAGRRCRPA